MRGQHVYVVNKSTLVSDADVKTMTHAVNRQAREHFAPAWRQPPAVVHYLADETRAESGSWVLEVLDDSDQQGVLGWHTEDNNIIYGRVFARPSLDAGSSALTGTYAVSSVLSHEVLETLADPHVNAWADTGNFLVAVEVCDPVESDGYQIDGVQVSNFVTPEWFDAFTGPGEHYDYLVRCTKPFQMTRGGYWVQMGEGQTSQQFGFHVDERRFTGNPAVRYVFGPEFPEWKKTTKGTTGSRSGLRAFEGVR